jgi:ribosomal-protein-alanine N-acetyltransferase
MYKIFDDFYLMPMKKTLFEPKRYEQWMCDQEVTKYNSHGLFRKSDSEINDWLNECENSKTAFHCAIMKAEEWVGMCSLQRIDWINRSAEIAIYIGEKDCWGKGIAKAAVELMLFHGFMKLNLNRIWSGTAESNIAMNKVFQNLGFEKEGCFREGMFLNGKYENVICYSLLEGDYYFECTRK